MSLTQSTKGPAHQILHKHSTPLKGEDIQQREVEEKEEEAIDNGDKDVGSTFATSVENQDILLEIATPTKQAR